MKDVLPNIHRTQAPEITPGRDGMVPSAADARCLQPAHTIRTLPGWREWTARFCPWCPWHLTFDLDIQTLPSEGPITSILWIWCKPGQQCSRYLSDKQKTKPNQYGPPWHTNSACSSSLKIPTKQKVFLLSCFPNRWVIGQHKVLIA